MLACIRGCSVSRMHSTRWINIAKPHAPALMWARTLLHDFTGQSLTFEAYSIKAFAGIKRKWSVQTPPIFRLWDLPLWPFWSYASDRRATAFGIKHLAQSLLWRHQRPARRRLGFPSWIWAGWEGRVTFPQHQSSLSFWSEIILEDHNGKTHRIDSWSPGLAIQRVRPFDLLRHILMPYGWMVLLSYQRH